MIYFILCQLTGFVDYCFLQFVALIHILFNRILFQQSLLNLPMFSVFYKLIFVANPQNHWH